jgi:hypothetical protein
MCLDVVQTGMNEQVESLPFHIPSLPSTSFHRDDEPSGNVSPQLLHPTINTTATSHPYSQKLPLKSPTPNPICHP